MLLKCSIEMMSFHMSSRRCSSFHMSFCGQLRLPPTLTRPICPVARWDAVWGILYTAYGILMYIMYAWLFIIYNNIQHT